MTGDLAKRRPRGARNPSRIDRGAPTAVGRNVAYRVGKVARRVEITGRWLDCGTADGGYTTALLAAGASTVVGTDVEPDRIAAARQRYGSEASISFEVAAAEALPFDDDVFDGVLLNEVLEHVSDEDRTLREIYRVLRPGGHLAVLSPNRFFPFEGHGMHVGMRLVNMPIPLLPWVPGSLSRVVLRARNYWPRELAQLVARNGFRIAGRESVFPVFEVYPWMPARIIAWYQANMLRIETAPIISHFGVSTLVIGQKAGRP